MVKIFLILIGLLITNVIQAYQYDLAICAISKDDEAYLKEWIEFHKVVGVQHFYIYCDGNLTSYSKILKNYIESGEVDLFSTISYQPVDGIISANVFNTIQCGVYSDLVAQVHSQVKWLAVIDTDEYLFPTSEDNLTKFLSKFEENSRIGGIGVNWHMFGTSWVTKIAPNKTLIESLTLCTPENCAVNSHIKVIVRPECISHFSNPHFPIYNPNYLQINTDEVPFEGPFSPYIQFNQLKINHYWSRDQDFFWNYKIPRQMSWYGGLAHEKEEELNIDCNLDILRFVPALRQNLNLEN